MTFSGDIGKASSDSTSSTKSECVRFSSDLDRGQQGSRSLQIPSWNTTKGFEKDTPNCCSAHRNKQQPDPSSLWHVVHSRGLPASKRRLSPWVILEKESPASVPRSEPKYIYLLLPPSTNTQLAPRSLPSSGSRRGPLFPCFGRSCSFLKTLIHRGPWIISLAPCLGPKLPWKTIKKAAAPDNTAPMGSPTPLGHTTSNKWVWDGYTGINWENVLFRYYCKKHSFWHITHW